MNLKQFTPYIEQTAIERYLTWRYYADQCSKFCKATMKGDLLGVSQYGKRADAVYKSHCRYFTEADIHMPSGYHASTTDNL